VLGDHGRQGGLLGLRGRGGGGHRLLLHHGRVHHGRGGHGVGCLLGDGVGHLHQGRGGRQLQVGALLY